MTDEGLIYTDRVGQEHLLPADAVLCAVGMRACTDVMEELWNVVDEQYVIGDCVKPAQVTQAISDAYYLAKSCKRANRQKIADVQCVWGGSARLMA